MLMILVGTCLAVACGPTRTAAVSAPKPQANADAHPAPATPTARPRVYGYEVVGTLPHSQSAFTQGLFIADGVLYETTGKVGRSVLIRHDALGGATARTVKLPDHVFGEGSVAVDDRIISLTWRAGLGHVHDLETMTLQDSFPIAGEGWGLTYDGERLIMSDGTNRLRFLDPDTYKETGTLRVFVGDKPVPQLNELEWINGEIWANVWMTDVVVRIDPTTGQVTSFIDLSGLLPPQYVRSNDVLNGIAYDPETDRLFVTGKRWPTIFEIKLTP